MAFEYGEETDPISGAITHTGSWGAKSIPKDAMARIIEDLRVLNDGKMSFPSLSQSVIQKFYNKEAVNIICYGDSITYGYTGSVQVDTPYPARLQSNLRNHFNNQVITVVNKGTNGQTSTQGLANMDTDVIALNPDLVIILYGINDVAVGTSLSDYASNLKLMVEKCITAGIVPMLLNPPPTFYPQWSEPTSDTNKLIYLYSGIVEGIAKLYDIGFMDFNKKIMELYLDQIYSYNYLQPDNFVHFNALGYLLMGDLVFWGLFDPDSRVLELDQRKDITIPACFSPFVFTNIVGSEADVNQFYSFNLKALSDSTLGGFFSFDFVVSAPHMDLFIMCPKKPDGGIMVINIFGPAISKAIEIDLYSKTDTLFDVKNLILSDIGLGYYYMSINISNAKPGQTTVTPYSIYMSAFKFQPSIFYNNDASFSSGTVGNLNTLYNLIDSKIKYSPIASVTPSPSNLMLYNYRDLSLDLVNLKTLSIEFEGLFYAGSGISWFGNKSNNTLKMSPGYSLSLETSSIILNANGASIATATVTLDFTKIHLIQIFHSKVGLINVYIDGALLITVTDISFNAGFCGIYSESIASPAIIKLNSLRFGYVDNIVV
jgi:lysophospholipase L1-like esterase